MIVRIMGEGQLEVDDSRLAELNPLDDALAAAIETGDDDQFRSALVALLDAVRSAGSPVADDALVDSDLVLPYAEAHIDEVRALLSGEGLIPG
ncbi:MAG: PspA-associated protein PspAA [Jiangellaceae bacterium]